MGGEAPLGPERGKTTWLISEKARLRSVWLQTLWFFSPQRHQCLVKLEKERGGGVQVARLRREGGWWLCHGGSCQLAQPGLNLSTPQKGTCLGKEPRAFPNVGQAGSCLGGVCLEDVGKVPTAQKCLPLPPVTWPQIPAIAEVCPWASIKVFFFFGVV